MGEKALLQRRAKALQDRREVPKRRKRNLLKNQLLQKVKQALDHPSPLRSFTRMTTRKKMLLFHLTTMGLTSMKKMMEQKRKERRVQQAKTRNQNCPSQLQSHQW